MRLDIEDAGVGDGHLVIGAIRKPYAWRRRDTLHLDERIDGGLPQGRLGASARQLGAENGVAEILDDEQALIEVLGKNLRCRKAGVGERLADGDEGADILGEMGNGAIGFAVADRRTVGAARRVHQDDAAAVCFLPAARNAWATHRPGDK